MRKIGELISSTEAETEVDGSSCIDNSKVKKS